MRISAIGSGVNIIPLLPPEPSKPKSIVDILPKPDDARSVVNLLYDIAELKFAVIQWTPEAQSDAGYEQYLQFPNQKVKAMAMSIVSNQAPNDEKVFRIEQWVKENITYISDIENYGSSELWTYPTVTLERRSGDCEDGAFLIHSLALHADVPPDRLRTYGGMVWSYGNGLSIEGHGWTAYKRELDDQWVILDWCYWAKDTPIADRTPMRDDYKYIDDFFYVNLTGTTETPYTNRVRYAFVQKGSFINIRI